MKTHTADPESDYSQRCMCVCVCWWAGPVAAEGSLSEEAERGWREGGASCTETAAGRERDKEGGGRLSLSFFVWGRRGGGLTD